MACQLKPTDGAKAVEELQSIVQQQVDCIQRICSDFLPASTSSQELTLFRSTGDVKECSSLAPHNAEKGLHSFSSPGDKLSSGGSHDSEADHEHKVDEEEDRYYESHYRRTMLNQMEWRQDFLTNVQKFSRLIDGPSGQRAESAEDDVKSRYPQKAWEKLDDNLVFLDELHKATSRNEEAQTAASNVHEFAQSIAEALPRQKGIFQCTIHQSGSFSTGVKVGFPDEFDYLFDLGRFNLKQPVRVRPVRKNEIKFEGSQSVLLQMYNENYEEVLDNFFVVEVTEPVQEEQNILLSENENGYSTMLDALKVKRYFEDSLRHAVIEAAAKHQCRASTSFRASPVSVQFQSLRFPISIDLTPCVKFVTIEGKEIWLVPTFKGVWIAANSMLTARVINSGEQVHKTIRCAKILRDVSISLLSGMKNPSLNAPDIALKCFLLPMLIREGEQPTFLSTMAHLFLQWTSLTNSPSETSQMSSYVLQNSVLSIYSSEASTAFNLAKLFSKYNRTPLYGSAIAFSAGKNHWDEHRWLPAVEEFIERLMCSWLLDLLSRFVLRTNQQLQAFFTPPAYGPCKSFAAALTERALHQKTFNLKTREGVPDATAVVFQVTISSAVDMLTKQDSWLASQSYMVLSDLIEKGCLRTMRDFSNILTCVELTIPHRSRFMGETKEVFKFVEREISETSSIETVTVDGMHVALDIMRRFMKVWYYGDDVEDMARAMLAGDMSRPYRILSDP